MVVVCETGWDGYRVLGVFANEDVAIKALTHANISCDEKISFDFVEVNKVSHTMSLDPYTNSPIKRTHIYGEINIIGNATIESTTGEK
jgi:hypothetical protein